MEWPPKFTTYDEFNDELQEAIVKHPHFEKWLLSKYIINKNDNYNNNFITPDRGNCNIGYSVEELKHSYYKEQDYNIKTNIINRSILELTLKNNTYTKEDKELEEIYYKQKKEYDSIIDEQEKLARAGYKNLRKAHQVNKPVNMKFREVLPKSIEALIEKNEELIKIIYSNNPLEICYEI